MALSDELSKFIPKDFGKKKSQKEAAAAEVVDKALANKPDKSDLVVSQVPKEPNANSEETLSRTKDSDRESDEEYPVASHITMKEHSKAVSALAWSPSGDVLVSGDNGSLVHMWDFSAMDAAYRPTRTLVPFEGQQVRDLRFNRSGSHFLCATNDPRAKLYDADGYSVCEFKRGDMYVSDMRKTSGHVAGLTSVDWNPQSDDVFASA
ncbi:hypothetical protein GGI21_003127, partial [Coemansia aciculifera]